MDFQDTPEEAAFREEARTFLAAHAEPLADGETQGAHHAALRHQPGLLEKAQAWQATKADHGWACITWPTGYGGRGASPIENVIWGQEEARYRVPPNMFGIGQGMLGPTIMTHGTEAQKARHLPPMLRGELVWCQLFSEPAAGSDLAGLRAAAVRDGDEWLVNGQKIWTSGAHYSKWGMVLTRTDPTAVKHAGITYFIVDMESPGIEIRPIRQINGATNFNEVFFTDVRIPDENRVGGVDDGWRCALTTLMNERSSIGAGQAGLGFPELLALARETTVGGRPALEDRAVREQLADFFVKLRGLQYTSYRTLTALSRGQTPGPQSSVGKLVGAPLRQRMAAFAMDLQGAGGVLLHGDATEATWAESYLAAPGLRLAGGTDEILRNIVAERVLGLPGEARADKGLAFQDVPTGPLSR